MNEQVLRVGDVMSRDVKTVERNDTLAVADEIMTRARIRHVVVVDPEGRVAGVLSTRDMFKGALASAMGYGSVAQRRTLEGIVAKEAMTTEVATIGPGATVVEAARMLADRKIGCLPVLDAGVLVGVLTESDIVLLVAEGRAA